MKKRPIRFDEIQSYKDFDVILGLKNNNDEAAHSSDEEIEKEFQKHQRKRRQSKEYCEIYEKKRLNMYKKKCVSSRRLDKGKVSVKNNKYGSSELGLNGKNVTLKGKPLVGEGVSSVRAMKNVPFVIKEKVNTELQVENPVYRPQSLGIYHKILALEDFKSRGVIPYGKEEQRDVIKTARKLVRLNNALELKIKNRNTPDWAQNKLGSPSTKLSEALSPIHSKTLRNLESFGGVQKFVPL